MLNGVDRRRFTKNFYQALAQPGNKPLDTVLKTISPKKLKRMPARFARAVSDKNILERMQVLSRGEDLSKLLDEIHRIQDVYSHKIDGQLTVQREQAIADWVGGLEYLIQKLKLDLQKIQASQSETSGNGRTYEKKLGLYTSKLIRLTAQINRLRNLLDFQYLQKLTQDQLAVHRERYQKILTQLQEITIITNYLTHSTYVIIDPSAKVNVGSDLYNRVINDWFGADMQVL